MLGIIGGTGIYSLGKFEERQVNTPYGFAPIYLGKISGEECAFIPRHGKDNYPPHKINYRANIRAFNVIGVEGVLATYARGAHLRRRRNSRGNRDEGDKELGRGRKIRVCHLRRETVRVRGRGRMHARDGPREERQEWRRACNCGALQQAYELME